MIWYKTGGYKEIIEKIEAEDISTHFLMINGQRVKKKNEYRNFFETKQEAIDFLLKKYKTEKERIERNLISIIDIINEIEKINNGNE